MLEVGSFELSRDGLVAAEGGAGFDLLSGKIDGDVLLFPVHGAHGIRGNQHLPAREPLLRVGDQIPDGPVPIVEGGLLDHARFPVAAMEGVTLHRFGFVQHAVPRRFGWTHFTSIRFLYSNRCATAQVVSLMDLDRMMAPDDGGRAIILGLRRSLWRERSPPPRIRREGGAHTRVRLQAVPAANG